MDHVMLPQIENEALATSDLIAGSLLLGGGESLSSGAITTAISVGNLGGIRVRARAAGGLAYVALESTGAHAEWPDTIDRTSGEVVYFGENRTNEKPAHEKKGNRHLISAFSIPLATPTERASVPVFFVFGPPPSDAPGRSAVFEGLAVPGDRTAPEEWCITRVFRPAGAAPFDNVVVRLTLLADRTIRRAWLDDLVNGQPISANAPDWYRWWVQSGERVPLCRR